MTHQKEDIIAQLSSIIQMQLPDMKPEQVVMELLQHMIPEKTPEQLLADELAKQVKGSLPPWSGRHHMDEPYHINNVTTATVGNFSVAYFRDGDVIKVALVERSERGEGGEKRYGALGGYVDLDKKEQSDEGAARELREEAIRPAQKNEGEEGVPVITPHPDRFTPVISGIDYRNPRLPTQYTGHMVELTQQEFEALSAHSHNIQNDPHYAQACRECSHGEITHIHIMLLDEVIAMGIQNFTHPHEHHAYEKTAEILAEQQKRTFSQRLGSEQRDGTQQGR